MTPNDPTSTSKDRAAQSRRAPSHNPMGSGSGTPWEDRGERGMLTAFFANTSMGLRHPMKLLQSIRRPETTSDAFSYTIGCGLLCSFAWVINSFAFVYKFRDPKQPLDEIFNQTFYVGTVLQFIIAPVALWAMVKVASSIYYKMAGGELRGHLQSALIFNIYSYALAPCLVALIPLIGPPLALLWILAILIFAGRERVHLSLASSVVDAVLSVLGVIIPAIATYFLVDWLFPKIWGLWFGS